ncbi:MAG: hypothetical protein GX842_01480 [Spirochaetales bacterium]|jgi:hypothetical protein|nr:hypothetical protein [Spirochaetales bacterium]
MGKFSFFGSFLISILIIIALYFVLYFFLPQESERFFGFSYQSTKDLEQLKDVVTRILSQAGVAHISIEEYMERLDSPELHRQLKEGEDLASLLVQKGEGIDFSNLRNQTIEKLLRDGLANRASFSTKQRESLIRFGLDYLLESH